MHISKEMLNEELRRAYYPAKLVTFLLSKPRMVRLVHKLETRLSGKGIDELHCEEKFIPGSKGAHQIRIRIFRPKNILNELPGFLYLHGGGYLIGNPESYLAAIHKFIKTKPCVIVTPDYRKAIDAPYPAALDDCYDTLLWMKENAEMLGIIPDKFVVGGHSAGGGLTAAVSLKARDTQDVQIAFQMPIYPMIDDRQNTDSAQNCDAPAWNSKTNQLGWHEYLKDLKNKNLDIPIYAAAARAADYAGLPPTITFVGNLEPFRDETINYVENLKNGAVPVRFRLFEGVFHGFDIIAPNAGVSKAAWEFVLRSFSEYIDNYFYNNSDKQVK